MKYWPVVNPDNPCQSPFCRHGQEHGEKVHYLINEPNCVECGDPITDETSDHVRVGNTKAASGFYVGSYRALCMPCADKYWDIWQLAKLTGVER